MKTETFFEIFDLIAGAPGSVTKMRALVLELAVRGRLVEQNPSEGSADRLLEAMAIARKNDVGVKSNDEIEAEELSEVEGWHQVPVSWRWVRLRDVGKIVGGGTPRSDNPTYFAEEGIPWLTPADLNGFKHKRILRGRRCITDAGLKESSARLLPAGSVLFSSRAPIGYVAIAGVDLATNQGFKSCVPFIGETNEFLYYYLLSVAARIDREASGTTFREVSGKIISQVPVPLPPLAEQKRIVAKVDELMALCDRLEEELEALETRYATLARASLARFAEAPTPANLDFLFHPSYAIPPADLRKSILMLAVRGKLVPQDPSDEPADKLWKRIENERREYAEQNRFRMHAEGEVKAGPFELPANWKWVRLASLFNVVTDGDHLPPPKSENGVAFLTIGNITTGKLEFDSCRFVHQSYFDALASFRKPTRGDILYTVVGATYGRPALVEGDRPFCVQRHIAILKPPAITDVGFLLSVLKSPLSYDQASDSTTGTAQPTIPLGALRNFVVPLAPLAEQHRIVAKVDELMALVDALEVQLETAKTTGEQLLGAAVAELTQAA